MRDIVPLSKKRSFALVGEEDFFKTDALTKLRSHWLTSVKLDEDRFDGAEGAKVGMLDEYIGLPPLVGQYRLVLIHNADRIKNLKKLNYWLKDEPDSEVKIVCVFSAETKDYTEAIKGLDFECVVVCNDMGPDSKEFDKYLEFCMQGTGRTLAPDAVEVIRKVYSDQLHLIKAELQKVAYLVPRGSSVTAIHLAESLAYRARSQIFDVADLILKRDVRGALSLMSELLERGEAPLVTVAILMRRLQQLEKVTKALNSGERLKDFMIRTRMPLFQYGQILDGLRNIKIYHFQKYYETLCEYESRLRGWGNQRNTVENMIVRLCL